MEGLTIGQKTDRSPVFDPLVHRRGSHPGDRRDGARAAQVGATPRRDSEATATKGSSRRWPSSSPATFSPEAAKVKTVGLARHVTRP
ncbi:unnamed protein product [Urochloa humidicola]